MSENPPVPLMLPVGHYSGAFPNPDDPATPRHEIRRGADVVELDPEQFALWALAHGLPDNADGVIWDRGRITETADGAQVPDAAGVIDDLLGRRVLVEVPTEGPGAVEFARTHQIFPLMFGLGNTPDEPWMYSIGFTGQAVLQATRNVYSLWEWAHMDDNLWDACRTHAKLELEAGSTEPEEIEPERVLGGLLVTLHALLGANAAYLDVPHTNDALAAG